MIGLIIEFLRWSRSFRLVAPLKIMEVRIYWIGSIWWQCWLYLYAEKWDFYENGLDAFTEEDISKIESILGCNQWAIMTILAMASSTQTKPLMMWNDGRWNCFKLKMKGAGPVWSSSLQASDYYNENPVVVIDQTAAKAIKKRSQALIGQSIKIGGHLFEVVGIMKDRNGGSIISTSEDYVVAEVPENV